MIFERFDILKKLKYICQIEDEIKFNKEGLFCNEILRHTWYIIGEEISLNSFLAITSDNLIYQKITTPIIFNIF